MSRAIIIVLALTLGIGFRGVAQEDTARHWLADSAAHGAGQRAGGVSGQYQAVQLRLVRSLTYASMGDIGQALAHMPFASDADDWLSGGDGMVRQLLVRDALRGVHAAVFRHLAANDDFDGAREYIHSLNPLQTTPDIYFELGRYFGPGPASPGLGAEKDVQFRLGSVARALADGDEGAARRLMSALDTGHRMKGVDQLGQLLMLDGDFGTAGGLYSLDAGIGPADPARLANAAMVAARAGSPSMVAELASLLDDKGDEEVKAQLALAMVESDAESARRLFNQTTDKQSRTWETVALQLRQDAWLSSYYGTLKDRWRRAERYYQLALRQLREGNAEQAAANARLAEQAASEITSATNRALAYQLLAQHHAAAGHPARVLKALDGIGDDEGLSRYRDMARSQLAIAWAASGNPEEAMSAANRVTDGTIRIDGLCESATRLRPMKPSAYGQLIDAAISVAGEMIDPRAQAKAWQRIVSAQLKAGDVSGAETTSGLALAAGDTGSMKALVTHHLDNNDFGAASGAAQRLPEDKEWTRQKAFSDIVESASWSGEIELAQKTLEKITQVHIRDLSVSPLVRAMIEGEDYDQAEDVLATVSRDDVRAELFSMLVYEQARIHRLPSPELMQMAPKRANAALCWAVAAASRQEVDATTAWLDQLSHPDCKAFALVGAAYSRVRNGDTGFVFSFIDPARTNERMSQAMQRQAIMSR